MKAGPVILMAEFVVRDPRLNHVHLEVPGERGTVVHVRVPVQGQGFFRRATMPDALVPHIKGAHCKKILRVNTTPAVVVEAVVVESEAPGPELSAVELVTMPASPQAKRGHR